MVLTILLLSLSCGQGQLTEQEDSRSSSGKRSVNRTAEERIHDLVPLFIHVELFRAGCSHEAF